MLLLITLVMVGIGSVMLINIYSIFSPFVENLGDIKNYNQAYYGAIGGIERAELVLKFHKGGFEGSGGWLNETTAVVPGPTSDNIYNTGFGVVGRGSGSMRRQIKSRTTQHSIPEPGEGDVEVEMQWTGGKLENTRQDLDSSSNYNMLEPDISQEFVLYIDNTTDTNFYYTGIVPSVSNKVDFNGNNMNITLRLPPKVFKDYGGNQNTNSLFATKNAPGADLDGDSIDNDIIVNRSLFGDYDGGGSVEKFTISPRISVEYGTGVNPDDSNIREDVINRALEHNGFNLSIDNNGSQIIENRTQGAVNDALLNPIPEIFADGKSLSGGLANLQDALTLSATGTKLQNLHFKLSTVNYPKTADNQLYPFLEYKIDLGNVQTSDRNFNIRAESKVGRFNVRVIIQRPILKTTANQDFTILF